MILQVDGIIIKVDYRIVVNQVVVNRIVVNRRNIIMHQQQTLYIYGVICPSR